MTLRTYLHKRWPNKKAGRHFLKALLLVLVIIFSAHCSKTPTEEQAHDRVSLMDMACIYKFRDGTLSSPHHPVFCRTHQKSLGITKDLGAYWTEKDDPDGIPCKFIFIGNENIREIILPSDLKCDSPPIKPVVNEVIPYPD